MDLQLIEVYFVFHQTFDFGGALTQEKVFTNALLKYGILANDVLVKLGKTDVRNHDLAQIQELISKRRDKKDRFFNLTLIRRAPPSFNFLEKLPSPTEIHGVCPLCPPSDRLKKWSSFK